MVVDTKVKGCGQREPLIYCLLQKTPQLFSGIFAQISDFVFTLAIFFSKELLLSFNPGTVDHV